MKLVSVNDRLPENNRYVLARVPKQPWGDNDDQEGCFWKVVKFVRGISIKERDALPDGHPRKSLYSGGDEHFNNRRPYHWEEFGTGHFFGQDVDYWCELPRNI